MSSDIAEKVGEKTGEVVAEVTEEAIDGVVDVVTVVRSNPVALAVVGLTGVAIGAVGGYFIAKKKLESFYEQRTKDEIAEAKEFYKGLNKVDDDGAILTPQEVLASRHGEEAVQALRTYQGDVEVPEPTELPGEGPWDDKVDEAQLARIEHQLHETRNVFIDNTFDLEEEMKHRSEDKPYVIHHDEYFEAEKDYDNVTLTYFEVDDTLVDETDTPIPDVDDTIGDEAIARFGHGSKDRNIVYVRNDVRKTDYEVSRSNGSYLEEVLGLQGEANALKHSDQRDRRREFRRGD